MAGEAAAVRWRDERSSKCTALAVTARHRSVSIQAVQLKGRRTLQARGKHRFLAAAVPVDDQIYQPTTSDLGQWHGVDGAAARCMAAEARSAGAAIEDSLCVRRREAGSSYDTEGKEDCLSGPFANPVTRGRTMVAQQRFFARISLKHTTHNCQVLGPEHQRCKLVESQSAHHASRTAAPGGPPGPPLIDGECF